ncbi:MAG: TOBE domain-containing protein [Methylococcaceae bacterium]|nr:TOBE domain-containing protein [Methylococcaceae bacterium]
MKMLKKTNIGITTSWVEGELRLAGMLDNRMITLLKAVNESGSINQAAKQVGLSYKGAWQIIERANNLVPKVLISTATGGSKGGGTSLTAAGQALLSLFIRLEHQHRQFLQKINQGLADDPEMLLLLKPLTIKTSATNQLFGTITAIKAGAVNAEVFIELKGGERIVASQTLAMLESLELAVGGDVLLLINASEIRVVTAPDHHSFSARNCISGKVIRVRQDAVESEIVIQLSGGDSLAATITQTSAEALGLSSGVSVHGVFKSNAVIIAALTSK